jgi:hypothetical protein
MNLLGKAFHVLRDWLGLADPSLSHPTPSHGWLLPAPALARQQRLDAGDRRARRILAKDHRA